MNLPGYKEQTDAEKLELLVDEHGLSEVLDMLATICYEKSDHVQSNWQDKELAKAWMTNGKRIDNIRVVPTY